MDVTLSMARFRASEDVVREGLVPVRWLCLPGRVTGVFQAGLTPGSHWLSGLCPVTAQQFLQKESLSFPVVPIKVSRLTLNK